MTSLFSKQLWNLENTGEMPSKCQKDFQTRSKILTIMSIKCESRIKIISDTQGLRTFNSLVPILGKLLETMHQQTGEIIQAR